MDVAFVFGSFRVSNNSANSNFMNTLWIGTEMSTLVDCKSNARPYGSAEVGEHSN
jgi:hypothetical protein